MSSPESVAPHRRLCGSRDAAPTSFIIAIATQPARDNLVDVVAVESI
jgi:hypothetical protein